MSYFAPYIDKTGFHMPTYIDIRDQMCEDARSIFGQDIYLGEDSQDYQYIAITAEKIYDAFQIAQQVYNNRAPNTAIGSALDGVVKINGIKRKAAAYSKCNVIINGVPGTNISNGVILDKGNIQWNLPGVVTIPDSGEIIVEATCSIAGPIVANIGDLTGIYNPTYGWNGVRNEERSTIGAKVEDDSKLRKRQSVSTAQPSNSMLEGTKGAVAQTKDVTRSEVYENDTNLVDKRGLPPHSITVIAEGGDEKEIAEAIWIHKGPGCYTNGDIEIEVTDSKNQVTPIRFFRPEYIDIDVVVNVKALDGYTTAITDKIKDNLVAYLNEMDIGAYLALSSLWGISLQAMKNLSNPIFSITSITASRHGEEQKLEDISMGYKEVCRGDIDNIVVNVV